VTASRLPSTVPTSAPYPIGPHAAVEEADAKMSMPTPETGATAPTARGKVRPARAKNERSPPTHERRGEPVTADSTGSRDNVVLDELHFQTSFLYRELERTKGIELRITLRAGAGRGRGLASRIDDRTRLVSVAWSRIETASGTI
jgi:hypothetical protein